MKTIFYDILPKEAALIREEVFIKEQGFKNEFDETDNNSVHLVLFDDNNKAVGTGRLFGENSEVVHFGRIAVLKEERKNHYGSLILKALENKAKELKYKKIELSAQVRIKDFYKNNGYAEIGDTFFDEYCKHIIMTKSI